MNTKTFLLITITVLNSPILVAQLPPKVIPARRPIVIPLPTNNHTPNFNKGKNGMEAESHKMSPSFRIPSLSGGDEGGLIYFANYNTEQGLALNSIACGYRDKAGNLWFGTLGGGVSRYDGKSFTNFTTVHGLASNIIYSITEDKTGNLWFGTSGSGVSRYDGKSFTNFTTAHGLANNTVWSITNDRTGNLWFGTSGGGASRYDGKSSFTNFTTVNGLANNTVRNIKEDKTGNLWFATDGGGVSRYDGKSFTNFSTATGLANNTVYSITEDKAGNLWFGTSGGGVSRYDGQSFINFTTAEGLANDIVYDITEDKTGNLWFATDGGGVSRYDGKSFANFTTAQGLANNSVWSITKDKTGHLWFGTFGGGLSRFVGKAVTNFTMAQGLANNFVYTIAEDKTGNLWLGTLGGGVSRYDGKSFTNFTTAQGLSNDTIRCIVEDKKGNLWFATDGGGVSRYDGKSFTNFTTAQGLANNIVFSIAEDKKGNLWFGTDGGGVSRYDGKSFTNFTTAQGLANNNVWSILEDKKGNVWFATYGGGLSRYDGRSFTNYTTAQGLANNDVWNITEDQFGNLWFGTGDGVSRYDGKSFVNFTAIQGLADDEVYDIVIDSDGNIFIGTDLGLSVLKGFKRKTKNANSASETGLRSVVKEEIISAVNSLANQEVKNYEPVFELYNQKTGYPIKALNINALFIDSKGIIWGGFGDNKLIRFDYKAVLKSTEAPEVLIKAIKIGEENMSWYGLMKNRKKGKPNHESDSLVILNEEVLTFGRTLSDAERDSIRNKFSNIKFNTITGFYPLPKNLVLPYNHNSVTFDFVAIEPARHFLVRYQYILEGYDKDWSPVTDKTSATFGNIYEGEYTFKLKARSPDGIWSKPISYTFRVLPPWYRTWWAYIIFGLLLISSVWGFIFYRSRKLRDKNRLLEEKVLHRTAQLKQSLEHLKSTQSQLIQREKMASLGELTAGIAHEIQNPLNFVNNFSEVNTELIEEIEQQINKGNIQEIKAIANNIKENEQKINHHGKRADAIVKGMLQHSHSSSVEKEASDINKLAEQYLRLSYQGVRAKEKSFYAAIQTDFDPSLVNIKIVPQDIGSALLNLFNNAFYSILEKREKRGEGYEPTVSVSTKKINGKVEIHVRDNGLGIPQKVIDKIYQPFFTTKPTGQGTGLGLSLSYDIIKAHGGEIKVETKENEFAEFIIVLPA